MRVRSKIRFTNVASLFILASVPVLLLISLLQTFAKVSLPTQNPIAQVRLFFTYRVFKRLVDVLASLFGLIFLAPLFLVIAIAVKLSSHGPVLYRATRVGQAGKPFKLYKFRSMIVNADKTGPAITVASDSRVTSVGRFLRRTKIDELPQLLNVLKGEMSLVGPRPESPKYVEIYSPEQRQVLNVRPGITSPASVKYRNEEAELQGEDWETHYLNIVMPTKIAIDLQYAQKPTLQTDITVLWETLKALLN